MIWPVTSQMLTLLKTFSVNTVHTQQQLQQECEFMFAGILLVYVVNGVVKHTPICVLCMYIWNYMAPGWNIPVQLTQRCLPLHTVCTYTVRGSMERDMLVIVGQSLLPLLSKLDM